MEKFLKKVVEYLYKKYNDELSDLCIVFPGRRAIVFFNRYLSEISDKPLWAPTFLSINELMQKTANVQVTDKLTLVFQLYKTYIKERKINESFDNFHQWGEMLLNDFDNVDKYLVPAEKLFQNISSLKDIDKQFNYLTEEQIEAIKQFWENFDPEKTSKQKENFIDIWKVLYKIYTSYRKELREKDMAYEGMIYRDISEKIQENKLTELPYKKYIFIGFNALNNCEESLFKYLKRTEMAEFFWDYDNFYLTNKDHEAGYFLRKNMQQFPAPIDFYFSENEMLEAKKEIKIISTPSDVSQAKIINQLIKEQKETINSDYTEFAIVLADEGLLFPVIHSLPEDIKNINVTMGYPLKSTAVSSLLDDLLLIQKNARVSKGVSQFYHKEVISLLSHQYFRYHSAKECKELRDSIIKNNMILIPESFFAENEFFSNIFKKVNTHIEFSAYLINVLNVLFDKMQTVNQSDGKLGIDLDKEFVYRLFLLVKRLNELIREQGIQLKLDTYIRLLKGLMRNITIPFIGEPLQGIQIMGILESRVLDFENVIILSMNEGILPKTDTASSYIPYNLRKGFDMPVIEHQDAMYAYYFYRIIQRAKNVTLVYSEAGDEMSKGEMSRFLYQLKYDKDINIKENSLVFEVNNNIPKEISIEKTNEVAEKLNAYINNEKPSFSPSAINTYIDCSLKFYFRYIAKIYQQDEVLEDIDPAIFGLLVHNSMETLYNSFLNKVINISDLKNISKNNDLVRSAIDSAVCKEFTKSKTKQFETGANLIINDIIYRYIQGILKQDMKYAPFTVLGLEQEYSYKYPVSENNYVTISGTIDRIDKIGDEIRIIDYKTGRDNLEFAGIDSLFEKANEKRNKAVLQTFIYTQAYKDISTTNNKVIPGLYFIRSSFEKSFDYHLIEKHDKYKKTKVVDPDIYLENFNTGLKEMFIELFDKSHKFTQCENEDICKFCDYKKICNR